MTRDQVIEKIKKLLRMKRGGTQGEIENALAMAAELARKHGINLDSVDPDAVADQPISHIDATTSARIQWECKYAALVCEQFFNVTALLRDARAESCRRWRDFKITLIGTDHDTQIALYVYLFLTGAFRRAWNNRANRRLRDRQQFLWGMYIAICHKLEEQKQGKVNEAGLILIGRAVERRKEYQEKTFGEVSSHSAVPDSDSKAAKYAGYAAGEKTEIRPGVGAGSAPAARPQLPAPVGQLALL